MSQGEVYQVTDTLFIDAGVTLTVESGVTITVDSGKGIYVNGALFLNGTNQDRVTVKSSNTSPARGDWNGIWVFTNGSMFVNFATIQHGTYGINFSPNTTGDISRCVLQTNTTGIYLNGNASVPIRFNTIEDNDYAVRFQANTGFSTNPTPVVNNIIRGNKYGVYVGGNLIETEFPKPVVLGNSFANNSQYSYYAIHSGGSSVILDATHNWWSTTDIEIIETNIYDRNDDPSSPKVNYGRFLNNFGGNVVGPTLVLGDIEADTIFPENSTHLINTNVKVDAGVTLTLLPGVKLLMFNSWLNVHGSLVVTGETDNKVEFVSGSASPSNEDWFGIAGHSGGNIDIDNAVVKHASNGINFKSGSTGSVTNSEISDNRWGIYPAGSSAPLISGNRIINNVRGIYFFVSSSEAVIDDNQIAHNEYGIYAQSLGSPAFDPKPVVNGNSIHSNAQYGYYSFYYGDSDLVLDATGNWWGTDIESAIEVKIFDHFDSSSSPYVDYANYLLISPNDPDSDGDGVPDSQDALPNDPSETSDLDGDGIGDNSDVDIDGDGVDNFDDAAPLDASETSDLDGDGVGDNSDPDIDGDGLLNGSDNCQEIPNFGQLDSDNDGIGDACEIIGSITITRPTTGQTISTSTISVLGTLSGPPEIGVAVNARHACVYNNQFAINNVPVNYGNYDIEAQIDSSAGIGAIDQTTINRNGDSLFTVEPNSNCAVAPFEVRFILSNIHESIVGISVDYEGDGVIDDTTDDLNSPVFLHTYTSPGTYDIDITAIDGDSNSQIQNLVVIVQSGVLIDTEIQSCWQNIVSGLSEGNTAQV